MDQTISPTLTPSQARIVRWRRSLEEIGFSRQESARLLFVAWLMFTGRMGS